MVDIEVVVFVCKGLEESLLRSQELATLPEVSYLRCQRYDVRGRDFVVKSEAALNTAARAGP